MTNWQKQYYLHELEDLSGERFYVMTVHGSVAKYQSRGGDIAVRNKGGEQVANPDKSSPWGLHHIPIEYATECKEISKRKFLKSELTNKWVETSDKSSE